MVHGESVCGLGVLNGASASHGEVGDRWATAEARSPVRSPSHLKKTGNKVVAVGKGDRKQIWKTVSEYCWGTFPVTSEISIAFPPNLHPGPT